MKPHREMYVLADHCPECCVVPFYKGHNCNNLPNCDPCPRCGKKVASREHRKECEQCPFCSECCKELEGASVDALLVADGVLPYQGTDEYDVRYVKMMRGSIRAAKTTAVRTRMVDALAEFIFADSFQNSAEEQTAQKGTE